MPAVRQTSASHVQACTLKDVLIGGNKLGSCPIAISVSPPLTFGLKLIWWESRKHPLSLTTSAARNSNTTSLKVTVSDVFPDNKLVATHVITSWYKRVLMTFQQSFISAVLVSSKTFCQSRASSYVVAITFTGLSFHLYTNEVADTFTVLVLWTMSSFYKSQVSLFTAKPRVPSLYTHVLSLIKLFTLQSWVKSKSLHSRVLCVHKVWLKSKSCDSD